MKGGVRLELDEKWVTSIKEARLNPEEIKIPAYAAINKAKKVKYFDENGILRVCKIEEGLEKVAGIMKRDDGSYYVSLFERDFIGTQNATLFHKATAAVKEGMSMVDFLKICEDVRLVAKEKKVDPLDKYIKYIDAPSVERSADNPDMKSLLEAIKEIKKGNKLCVFPEGRRNVSGTSDLQEIKGGSIVFSIKAKCPIVPIMMLKKSKIFRKTHVIIGKPFELSDYYGKKLTEEDMNVLAEVVRSKMIEQQEILKQSLIKGKKKK